MKLLKLFPLLFILPVFWSERLEFKDFCHLTDKNQVCPASSFNYKCGSKNCARGQVACRNFRILDEAYGIDLLRNNIYYGKSTFVYKKNCKDFRRLKSQIKNCSQSQDSFISEENVCFNARNCFNHQMAYSEKIKYLNLVTADNSVCSCSASHPFKCEKVYCTLNEKVCDAFKTNYNQKPKFYGMKGCQMLDNKFSFSKIFQFKQFFQGFSNLATK